MNINDYHREDESILFEDVEMNEEELKRANRILIISIGISLLFIGITVTLIYL
jgi:hypothetical protein